MIRRSPRPSDNGSAPASPCTEVPGRPTEGARSRWTALIAISMGVSTVGFDGTVTAVANPVMAAALRATLSDLQLITNVYLLALASTMVLAGKFGDRFGRSPVFLIGVAGFGASSVVIGLLSSVEAVIAFRGLQGLFGSLLVTNALSLVRSAFPRERLATGISVYSAVNGVSMAAGPIIGGLVVETWGWEWAFMINGPIAITSLFFGSVVLRERRVISQHEPFDLLGAALLIGTTVSLTWAIVHAPEDGWGATSTLVLLGASFIVGVLFVRYESRARHPLIPLRLFRNRSINIGIVLGALLAFGLVSALFFVMLYLQNIAGLSPLGSGLRIIPMSLAMIVTAGIAGAVVNRFGPRLPLVGGTLITASAMFLLSTVDETANGMVLMTSFALLGLGLSFGMTAARQSVLGNVPEVETGAAAGIQQSTGQFGGILGVSVLGAIMASLSASKFTSMIAEANLPPDVVEALGSEHVLAAVSVGEAPIASDSQEQLATVIRVATETAFLGGMRTTLVIGAVHCVVGALVGLLAQRGSSVVPAAATVR